MDNLAKGNTSDIGLSGSTTGAGYLADWDLDQSWWRENFRDRPYVTADRLFEFYEPGYQFGYLAANRYRGQKFSDVESDLRSDFENFEFRGDSTWESVKDAVRDAWDKVTGKR